MSVGRSHERYRRACLVRQWRQYRGHVPRASTSTLDQALADHRVEAPGVLFGFNLFSRRCIVPKGVTMGDIYRSVAPFVVLQAIALVLMMVFPDLVTFRHDVLVR